MSSLPNFWDVIAPDGIGISERYEDYLVMKQSFGTMTYARPFYIPANGYPRVLETNWLNSIASSGEVDLVIDINKLSKRDASRMLQKQITIFKSNLSFQRKRGNEEEQYDLQTKIYDNEQLLQEIQFSENDAYHVAITGVLYADSLQDLNRYSDYIEDEMSSKFISISSTFGRIKKGFRSATPLVHNEIPEAIRNLDRRALGTLSPFISGSGYFNGGIPLGINRITGQKEFFNAFGSKEVRRDNYNMAIFGSSGSGKSVAMKLLLGRETVGMGMYSRLIDVEGEFVDVVKNLGGINVTLSEESMIRINPLAMSTSTVPLEDIVDGGDGADEELALLENSDDRVVIEKNGKKYVEFVPIREKINEALDFFDILCRGKNQQEEGLNVYERNYLERALKHIYTVDFGFSTHPSSLYTTEPREENGVILQANVRKLEPTLTDVYHHLVERYKTEQEVQRLLAAIQPFLRDGSKPIFDGQTYFGREVSTDLHTARIVNFNIKQMEEGFLRPIAYHVILNYIWEYFVKNPENELIKKVVYADELWTMIDSEQTVNFLEKMARRARKRNAGLRVASQDFVRILESSKARAILQNTETFFFLKQNKIDLEKITQNFNLTKGELRILFENPVSGEGILRSGKSSVWLRTDPSREELNFVESNAAVKAERQMAQRY